MNAPRLPQRVLIANRGEIAVRILRTLRELEIEVVAVHSEADRHSPHVLLANQSVHLGASSTADSYLRAEAVVAAALDTGVDAVHPGYGLLSENAAFARECESAGLVFIGPTPEQIEACSDKDAARSMARELEVPTLPGTGIIPDFEQAVVAAASLGYPVMLKSVAGGGGIGMRVCHDEDQLRESFHSVVSLAETYFGNGGVIIERFLARARHVEVQILGDGRGRLVALGERDCSVQRRNQKVIEECPAPGLGSKTRRALAEAACTIGRHLNYRSAGTIEFLLDPATEEFFFLEVNTRLQVEHGVTELCFGLDLVEAMVRISAGQQLGLFSDPPRPTGWAMQARVYAEDPQDGHRPSSGLLTEVHLPTGVRVDTWIATGTEISPWYDPLLAKVIAHGNDRDEARRGLLHALESTSIAGVATNLDELRAVLAHPVMIAGEVTTGFLAEESELESPTVAVLEGGTFTSVQDLPGRLGRWSVGVPPSGPMDDLSFRHANDLVANPVGAPALEITASGPTLTFRCPVTVAVTGAEVSVVCDGQAVPMWTTIDVAAGSELRIGAVEHAGLRVYLAVAGGFDVPLHLGSASTFVLGGFGGHGGRCLRTGDVLRLAEPRLLAPRAMEVPDRPSITGPWTIEVMIGPHGAPEFLTAEGARELLDATWTVHFNSDRTGVRLIGPKPQWARADGGEAGLHPSNIHDTPYTVGAVDLTGDMPIILGPDGPSLGGFVCPLTVTSADRWKIGQLRAGDELRFRAVRRSSSAVLGRVTGHDDAPDLVFRRSGDHHLLVECGPNVLDIGLRARVHALMMALASDPFDGMDELTPGIRSLQIRFDPSVVDHEDVAATVARVDSTLGSTLNLEVPSRIVHLPLSWDDPQASEAVARYARAVRPDAPWCPSNIEFIRRINGLGSIDEVQQTVLDAEYLVLGLGDVYLGAPVATPIDPRHRLITTKYNPARTWTPENAVGIGGAYMCVYGMEGPGGYQLVGRTVQVWNRWRNTELFGTETPWLLRFFDRIKFHLVDADELMELRDDLPYGRATLDIEEGTFRLADHRAMLDEHADSIDQFRRHQRAAFDAERDRWAKAGIELAAAVPDEEEIASVEIPTGSIAITTPVHGVVARVLVEPGEIVAVGQVVATVESMKMETPIKSPVAGEVTETRVKQSGELPAGGVIAVVRIGQ